MSKFHVTLSATVFAFAAMPVAAFASDEGEAAPDTIVVTALRTPVEQVRISSSITVLSAEAIEQAQPVAVSDVLLRTPGISLARNGGYGTTTSLRIRGADSGQSVLVIDGMRLADASTTDGGYNFANLLTDDITRIEILRGPQSILWGSNAIGGVINVQIRLPERPLEANFSVETGSYETVNARAGLGGTSDLIDWRIAGSRFTTEGISARSFGTEADGYTRTGGSANVVIKPAANVSIDLRGYYADARNDFDGFSGDNASYGLTEEWTVYAGVNAAFLNGRFTNRIAVLEGRTDRENYDPARSVRPLNFEANGRTRRYEYQGTFAVADGADVVFGAEREEHRMTTASPGNNTTPYVLTPYAADIDSVFGQARFTPIAGLTLNGGVRHDRHSRFGGNTIFSAGAAYALHDGATVLRAGYDEGFKAPSLYQLYSQYGTDSLSREKARGWEIGAEQGFWGDTVRVSAVWYNRKTENLIDFAFCPSTGPLPAACFIPSTTTARFGYYANVKQSRATGLELTGKLNLGASYMQGNYSIINAEDRTIGANFGTQLARVPRHLANIEVGHTFPSGITGSVAARYSGKTLDRAGGVTLDDYWIVDGRVSWKVEGGLTLFGRVENIFDTDYQTAGGYNSFRRSVYVGFRGAF